MKSIYITSNHLPNYSTIKPIIGDKHLVLFIHGYRFSPDDINLNLENTENPFLKLWNNDVLFLPSNKRINNHLSCWSAYLAPTINDNCIFLAIGWHSQPNIATSILRFTLPYRTIYKQAKFEGIRLANWLTDIVTEKQKVSVICHSLGSRVLLSILDHYNNSTNMHRAIILGGSAHALDVNLTKISSSHQNLNVFNIWNANDKVLDILAENSGKYFWSNSRVIGTQPVNNNRKYQYNWHDIPLHDQKWRQHISKYIAGFDNFDNQEDKLLDHWSYHTFKAHWLLYRELLFAKSVPRFILQSINNTVS